MTDRRRPRKAGQLMKQLRADASFIRNHADREKERKRRSEADSEALAPLVGRIRALGFPVKSLDELLNTDVAYRSAVPVMLEWLPRLPEANKEPVIRALSVPWAAPQAAAPLISEFRSVQDPLLRWAIGNALAIVADNSVAGELCSLVQDKSFGKAREMVTVALGNLKPAIVRQVLIEALDDPQVAGHAVIALGRSGDVDAAPQIEPFLKHSKPWIRREASKALARLRAQAKRK